VIAPVLMTLLFSGEPTAYRSAQGLLEVFAEVVCYVIVNSSLIHLGSS
jgi:hypothetical protein